jgi:hypothetical protein
MDLNMLRILPVDETEAFALICVACGKTCILLHRNDLRATPLAAIVARGEHLCSVVTVPLGPTPRPPGEADEHMRHFIESELTPNRAGVIRLQDLIDRYAARTGDWLDSGYFSRLLRKALPPGAEVRREMINGVRDRRLVGMSWILG